MTTYSKFISNRAKGMRAVRVVPKSTTMEDLSMFKLHPFESLSMFESKGRKYVELFTTMHMDNRSLTDRLNSISAYLKALHK